VGFFDALLGRTKPAQANLDRLFGLPGAQITLEAAEGLQPTGQAGVCFKPAEGQAFTATETEFTALLNLGDDAGAHVSDGTAAPHIEQGNQVHLSLPVGKRH